MRKLVTIRRISELRPIEGADFIELAIVDGWQCVVKKNQFKPGDYGLYHEIDCWIPKSDSRYSFLTHKSLKVFMGVPGEKIRTIKLKKQLSQGLMLPLSLFPEIGLNSNPDTDYAEVLGIQKYEPEIPGCMAGTIKSNFPSFIPKTDQPRIQNIAKFVFEKYKNELFEMTLKLDGSSMTVYVMDGQSGVCSRNYELVEDENNTFWKVAKESRIIDLIKSTGKNLAFQGELMGPGIQGNSLNLKDHRVYLFDVYDIDAKRYLLPDERQNLVQSIRDSIDWNHEEPEYWLDHVPVYSHSEEINGELFTNDRFEFESLEELLDYVDDFDTNGFIEDGKHEGLVFKHHTSSFSFKVISNEFLLREK